ncbi:hypothetical protein F5879DRAFT_927893 [Lentinula edodes]|uniref:uncharacterized protein n=1 Tax=Lentinula edodes TaxID=5353 RepID=UPI001E8E837E|nr:uncharacterized protein C8R40DRAFT_1065197 [Lentinula edodes]KAH7881543.1 hypothetical protein C8R40DRAFT_1065197 [Lentinula edodes]KAJ3897370.1 hypothetical protein F5879DRAFT_927893 [Lentinula edodes]
MSVGHGKARITNTPRAAHFVNSLAQNGTLDPRDDVYGLGPTDNQIPKPPGDVGKPGQGGYNLRIELEWAEDQFEAVEKYIGGAVEKILDITQSFSEQNSINIKQALEKYPFLRDYCNQWVVNDFIKSHLNSLKKKATTAPMTRAPRDYRVIQTRGRSKRSLNGSEDTGVSR